MRLFFGLTLAHQEKLAIVNWQEKAMPASTHKVAASNYHLTTAFLGEVNERQLDLLQSLVAESELVAPFSVTLDCQGYFQRAKVSWIGPQHCPAPLQQLSELCFQFARQSGIGCQQGEFVPHVTLQRNCKVPPPAALLTPDICISVTKLTLFESVSTHNGVRYQIVNQWPLPLPLNPRKREIGRN